jgi:hypothetical protein
MACNKSAFHLLPAFPPLAFCHGHNIQSTKPAQSALPGESRNPYRLFLGADCAAFILGIQQI